MSKNNWAVPLIAAVGSLLVSGCATVASRADTAGATPTVSSHDGLTYFLPRQLASVSAKRTESRLSKAVTAVAKAQAAVAEGEAKVAADETAVDRARVALVSSPDNAQSRRVLADQLVDIRADLRASRKNLTALQAKLTTATNTLTTEAGAARSGAPGAYDVTMAISLLKPSADPRFTYRLNPKHSALRDDEHKLTVNSAGLLATANTVATDRTADILVEIATFAGAIKGGALGAAPRDGRGPAAKKDCTLAPDEYSGVVDFADAYDVAFMNDDLQCVGVRLKVSGTSWPQSNKPVPDGAGNIEGIVYRTPVELFVRVEKCTKKDGKCEAETDWFPTQVIALALPQAGPISVIRQDAGLMTKSRYTLAFDAGTLNSYDASRPSEVLEVARTPMRLVNGFFEGFSKVISLRTGQTKGRTDLSTAELALLNARGQQQIGGVTNQRLLSEAELQLYRAQIAQQVGVIDGRRTLSEADLAYLRAQIALEAGSIEGQRALTAADLALLQVQMQLQSSGVTTQTQLTADQLALLNAQTNIAIARGNVPVQMSAAELAAAIALMRDQSRRDTLNRCVADAIAATPAAGTPDIAPCLQAP